LFWSYFAVFLRKLFTKPIPTIRTLSQSMINKIAAGEVIEPLEKPKQSFTIKSGENFYVGE